MQIVTISDKAKDHLATLLAANQGKQLRVSINNRGCSGHKYAYDLQDIGQQGRYDEVIEWDGYRLVIDAASIMGLLGSMLDLRETQFERHLEWVNPQATNHCGCGESFQLITDMRV